MRWRLHGFTSSAINAHAASDGRPRTERIYGAEPRHTLQSGACLWGLTRYRRQPGLIHRRSLRVELGDPTVVAARIREHFNRKESDLLIALFS